MLIGFFQDLWLAVRTAFMPTVRDVYNAPSLLMRPRKLSQTFMSYVWNLYGDGVDGSSKEVKEGLIRKWAKGIVLDLGAG